MSIVFIMATVGRVFLKIVVKGLKILQNSKIVTYYLVSQSKIMQRYSGYDITNPPTRYLTNGHWFKPEDV